MNIIRLFSSAARSVANSELAQLRKKTGFTLAICREALKATNNDLVEAEKWLLSKATELGWNKVAKVIHRPAAQGLVAIAKGKQKIAMIEVNCETDFVARTEKFVSFAETVANTCFTQSTSLKRNTKMELAVNDMLDMKTLDNESLMNCLVRHVGELGENLVLRRGVCYEADNNIEVHAAVHPASQDREVMTGRFGAFVAFQKSPQSSAENTQLGINICKHIIGMSPSRIGTMEEDDDEEVAEEKQETVKAEGEEEDEYIEEERRQESLVKQNFIMDSDVTVGQMLEENGVCEVVCILFLAYHGKIAFTVTHNK
ncbi:UNVERIFIED_CONTAM: hypothetical protein PYX00_006097 [Menopon gallinae]|uniref:Elongation factor Ts, mitochondrial n=1 Tax=Menopon gallinae TaxID=328185 RepID=A0AAW2HUN1_9NEOP